ncbi:MAG: hypothetical protein AB8B77_07975 [Alphaproteobacteria bacterium]
MKNRSLGLLAIGFIFGALFGFMVAASNGVNFGLHDHDHDHKGEQSRN